MISKKNKSLKYFVHVVLARRILTVTILFSLILSIIVHTRVNDDIYERVLITAHDRIETLRARTNEYLEKEGVTLQQAVDQAIDALSRIHYDQSIGNFVFYQISTIDDGVLANKYSADHSDIDDVKQYIDETAPDVLKNPKVSREIVHLDSGSYVYLIMPLYDKAGDLIGKLRAMFKLTQATMNALKNQVYAAVFYAIVIVMLTTAILYPVIINLTRKLVNFSVDLLDSNLQILQVLGGAIAKKDSGTNAHNYRVTIIATRLAEKINLPSQQIESLIKGAFLHDVGKIGIPDNILLKPGKLDEAEFAFMKTHVEKGLEIIGRSTWLTNAKDVVGSHHEKYDGSGYPKGLGSEQIPINARIFAISDVFDALTSKRPYKRAYSFEETMKILVEKSGTHFDPQLVNQFKLIAAEVYQELNDKNDEALRKILNNVIQKYFSTGLETLSY